MESYPRLFFGLSAAFIIFLYKLWKERNRFRKHSLPAPPHSWLFGHLPIVIKTASRYPKDLNFITLQSHLAREYGLESYPLYYLDLWPIATLTVVVLDGRVASQVAQNRSQPKEAKVMKFAQGFMGEASFATAIYSEGPEGYFWRYWRTLFNPGFSMQNLLTVVPLVLEEVLVFTDRLVKTSESGETVPLEHLMSDLTVDIIGRVVVDARFGLQKGRNELINALQKLPYLSIRPDTLNPLAKYNPIRILKHRYWANKTDTLIGRLLDERERNRRQGVKDQTKRVTDLALQSFEDKKHEGTANKSEMMDPTFRLHAIQNIRGFIFAGHETTSGALAYVIRFLSDNPSALSSLRSEHRTLFPHANQPSDVADSFSATPALLLKMPYTTACIHETLRMFPAAGTARVGHPDVPLRSPVDPSTSYPSHISGLDLPIMIGGYSLGRNGNHFPDPDTFRPERFIEDPSLAKSDHFRPFERGARDCIGKDLAMLEMKIALAMTVNWFDFELDYPKGSPMVHGEVAYPIMVGASKPVRGLPVKIKAREA